MKHVKLVETSSGMSSPVLYTRGRPNADRSSAGGPNRRVTDRLRQQIDSVFIPVHDDEDEQVHLLVETDDQSISTVVVADPKYTRSLSLKPLLHLDNFLQCKTAGCFLDAVVVGDEKLYFILSNSPLLYCYWMGNTRLAAAEDVDEESPLSMMPLRLESGGLDFFPQHLRYESGTRSLYMTGHVCADGQLRNLLLKLSIDTGLTVTRTKQYPVIEKFGDFDLAKSPNSASPADLWIASSGTSVEHPQKSQVFKLRCDFQKKLNFINLGPKIKPTFVTSDDHFVYVSATKTKENNDQQNEGPAKGLLLTFPAQQHRSRQETRSKEWLHVDTWDFCSLSPGKTVALRSERDCRILVADRIYGSLHLIIWKGPQPAGKPLCLPVHCCIGNDGTMDPIQRLLLNGTRTFVFTGREVFVGNVESLIVDPEEPVSNWNHGSIPV